MRVGPSPIQRKYVAENRYKTRATQYVIAFEGIRTEPQYFSGFKRYADESGGSQRAIQYIQLNRSYLEAGCSNPEMGCLPLLEQCLSEFKEEKMSLERLTVLTTDWAADACGVKQKENETYLRRLRDALLCELGKLGYNQNQMIDYENLEPVARDCYSILMKLLGQKNLEEQADPEKALNRYIEKINDQKQPFFPGDKAYLVIDRDRGSFTEDAYKRVLKRCRDKNINLIVSNPQFEFWLLLHFTDAKDYDAEKLLNDQSYLLGKLQEKTGRNPKKIKKINFKQYLPHVKTAIANEKLYEEDIEKLKDRLGTNVGTLLEEMIGEDR